MIFLDTETRSTVPIQSAGAIRYAESMECLSLHEIHLGMELQRTERPRSIPFRPDLHCVAHNATFDRHVVSRLPGGEALRDPSLWTCTAALCRYFGWPARLADAGKRAGLPEQKMDDSGGIQTFCIPPFVEPEDDPERWRKFMQYGDQDTEACRSLYYALQDAMPAEAWSYWENNERHVWELDQHINDQGFRVDPDTLANAVRMVPALRERLTDQMLFLTDGEVRSLQSPRLLDYLRSEFFLQVENLRKDSIAELLQTDDLHPRARALLELRQTGARNSIAKYQRMEDMVSADGRVRGGYLYHGGHTGRWSGQGVQPQNLTRPLDDLDPAEVAEVLSRCNGHLGLLTDRFPAYRRRPMDLFVSAVRGAITAERGDVLVIADYNQIEARVAAWLSGCERKLRAFVEHDAGLSDLDPYEVTAQLVLGDASRRQEGKILDLGLGFGMGWRKHAALTGLDEDTAKAQVYGWRDTYAEIPNAWRASQMAMGVHLRSTTWRVTGENLEPLVSFRKFPGGVFAALPNGKPLFYHSPRTRTWGEVVRLSKKTGRLEEAHLRFRKQFGRPFKMATDGGSDTTGQLCYMSPHGFWTNCFGGLLFENLVQAIAREILVHHMLQMYRLHGQVPVLHSHDEVVYEVPKGEATLWCDTLMDIMQTSPDWCQDLPLRAEIKTSWRYTK